MTLHLVIHRPEAAPGSAAEEEIRRALRDAVWEVADSHWTPGGEQLGEAMFVSCDLSPDYLVSHFRRSLARRGFAEAGMLVVTQLGERTAWTGVPDDAAVWIRDTL